MGNSIGLELDSSNLFLEETLIFFPPDAPNSTCDISVGIESPNSAPLENNYMKYKV